MHVRKSNNTNNIKQANRQMCVAVGFCLSCILFFFSFSIHVVRITRKPLSSILLPLNKEIDELLIVFRFVYLGLSGLSFPRADMASPPRPAQEEGLYISSATLFLFKSSTPPLVFFFSGSKAGTAYVYVWV